MLLILPRVLLGQQQRNWLDEMKSFSFTFHSLSSVSAAYWWMSHQVPLVSVVAAVAATGYLVGGPLSTQDLPIVSRLT